MELDKKRRPSNGSEENHANAKKQRDSSFELPENSDDGLEDHEEYHAGDKNPIDNSVEPPQNSEEELPVPEDRTHTIPDMEDFVERVNFPNNVGAIICGKQIWDRLLNFFNRININDDTYKRLFDLVEKTSSIQQTTPPAPNMEGTTTNSEPIDTETDSITPNEDLIEAFLSDYAKLKENLNATLSQFSTRELRQNTETKEDYDAFVDIRKDLTITYKSGQHLLKQIKDFKTKGHINIIKTHTSIIPVSIPPEDIVTFRKEIETTAQKQNMKILHKLLRQNVNRIKEINNKLTIYDPFIAAKAFRTVVLTNKDLSDGHLLYKTTQRQTEHRTYNTHKDTEHKSNNHEDQRQQYRRTRDQQPYTHTNIRPQRYPPQEPSQHHTRDQQPYTHTNTRPQRYPPQEPSQHDNRQQYREPREEFNEDFPPLPSNKPYHTYKPRPRSYRDHSPKPYYHTYRQYDTQDEAETDSVFYEEDDRNDYNPRRTYYNRRNKHTQRTHHLN